MTGSRGPDPVGNGEREPRPDGEQAQASEASSATRDASFEADAQPRLPASGELLGAIVKRMGISVTAVDAKTAQRYFSGRRVKDTSRAAILGEVAGALTDFGLMPALPLAAEAGSPRQLADVALKWHAATWDSIRSFLRPRMPRVQSAHMGLVWQASLRLAAIDLSLRLAAALHLAGSSSDALGLLSRINRNERGRLLNQLRTASGVTLEEIAEQVGVSDNAVDAWMYRGARPSDRNLVALSEALSPEGDSAARAHLLTELRRTYWASDLVGALEERLGSAAVDELLGRIQVYSGQALGIISVADSPHAAQGGIVDLALRGSAALLAPPLLQRLYAEEGNDEWRQDLAAVASDWTVRVRAVVYRIDQEEVAEIDQAMDGGLLRSWDVSSPAAYRRYQRATELQIEGRIPEALREVEKAIELDPQDPVPHFTWGSMVGGLGYQFGVRECVKAGLDECRIAAELDRTWILPWAEVGFILVGAGRPREALDHLLSVGADCGPLDSRYYMALGLAHQSLGNHADSLAAFEQALQIDPENLRLARGAGVAAVLHGDNAKAVRYARRAQHLGDAGATRERLEETASAVSEMIRNPLPPLL